MEWFWFVFAVAGWCNEGMMVGVLMYCWCWLLGTGGGEYRMEGRFGEIGMVGMGVLGSLGGWDERLCVCIWFGGVFWRGDRGDWRRKGQGGG